jgi:hypothetical protein
VVFLPPDYDEDIVGEQSNTSETDKSDEKQYKGEHLITVSETDPNVPNPSDNIVSMVIMGGSCFVIGIMFMFI